MKKNRFAPMLLLALMFFWVVIALARTSYNFSKLVTEKRQWYGKTDDQKRVLEFGDIHYFLSYVQNHTKSGTIDLFITDNDEDYYLSRYYLYPSKIIRPDQPVIWDPNFTAYTYYIVYPANHNNVVKAAQPYLKKYNTKKIATYVGENGQKGFIYTK